jgi:ATP-dependent helicase/nuclease subunit A
LDRGEIVHRLAEAGAACGEDGLLAMAEELLGEYGRPIGLARELVGVVAALRRSALWRRAAGAEKVFREAPFTIRMEGEGGMVLRRGVIDLAFRDDGEWVIVDYKSDGHVDRENPEKSAAKYAGQLAAYAGAWAALTGERVAETGVYFLRGDVYVTVEMS